MINSQNAFAEQVKSRLGKLDDFDFGSNRHVNDLSQLFDSIPATLLFICIALITDKILF